MPVMGKGQVRMDMRYAALNFPDTLFTSGKYQIQHKLPFVPGVEGVGVVTEIGEGVTHLKVGDRAMFAAYKGAFAQQAVADASLIVRVPDAMDDQIAAIFYAGYATTYHAFKQRANLQAGEIVVIPGAAGSTGIAAIEIAKTMGAYVIACASSDDKLAVCKNHGADALLNYSQTDLKEGLRELAPDGIDVVYDPVGGDASEKFFRNLRYNGRHLVIGFAAGVIPSIPMNLALLKQCQLVGVFMGNFARDFPELTQQNMDELCEL